LVNGSKLDEEVWAEFYNNWESLAYESELLIAKFQNKEIEQLVEFENTEFPIGKERLSLVKQRVNQSFFRSTVLSSYNLKCCITGLSIPDLLVSSHIIPWAKDDKNRLNPHNGLCLNSLHDKAFDKGYITITPDFKIIISKYFDNYSKDPAVNNYFRKHQNQPITLPDRFFPSKEFLEYHFDNIFIK
jgi:putative restriction endonuclease